MRRTLRGLRPFEVMSDGYVSVNVNVAGHEWHEFYDPQVGIIRVYLKPLCGIEVFRAEVINKLPRGGHWFTPHHNEYPNSLWRLFSFGESLRLEVEVPSGEAQVSLGLLLAVCQEIPKVLPTSSQRSLTIRLAVHLGKAEVRQKSGLKCGRSPDKAEVGVDKAEVREVEASVAPLRYVARTGPFSSQFMMGRLFCHGREEMEPLVVFKWTCKV